jgi:hypothetical protein
MEARTIRAWHYTRLTDAEIDNIHANGIHLSTLGTLRQRHADAVAAGFLTKDEAEALFAKRPLHQAQEVRSNRFFMTSHPVTVGDACVRALVGNWGGESTYHWLGDDCALKSLVAVIGVPRVLEIVVPLSLTRHASRAADAVIATFGCMLGCNHPDFDGFDLYAARALRPDAVIAIHTQGEPNFAALGQGYPVAFSSEG